MSANRASSRPWLALVAGAVVLAAAPGPAAAQPVTIHVSREGNDSWSGTLRRPNADGSDGPLASLEGARDKLRARRRAGLPEVGGVTIHAGRYRLPHTLLFTPEDSGLVPWMGAPGEPRPVISGSREVTGWRQEKLGRLRVWSSDASELLRDHRAPRALFVNGERRPRPRLPKQGYWRIESVPDRPLAQNHWNSLFKGSDSFVAARDTFRRWSQLEDVEVNVLHYWIEERLAVAAFDPASRLVRTARKTLMALVDETGDSYPRYFVENVKEALSPGEWYLDREAARLLYAPLPGERPETTIVELPVVDVLLRLEGEPEADRFVEGLHFTGLRFEQAAVPEAEPAVQASWTTPAAIVMHGAHGVAIEDSQLTGLGGYAVEIGDGCNGVNVVGNEIADAGAGGVKVDGAGAGSTEDPRRRTRGVAITDNHIHALGRVFPSAVGVLVRNAAEVEIAHNHIHDAFYTAVSVGWTWGYGPSVTRDVRVVKNHIHDIGQGVLSDMGGVYTLGIQPGSVVRGNLVHDVKAAGYGGWAIYPDEGSSHIVIEDNVAFDTSGHVFHQHYGNENLVRNNVFAFGREGVLALSRGPADKGGRGALAFTLERNILVSDGPPLVATGLADEAASAAKHPFLSDLNLFWNTAGPVSLGDGHSAGRGGLAHAFDLAAWQALGIDTHSLAADPRFVDLSKRDLRLEPGSPALALGFRPIDLADVGPRPPGKRH